METQHRVPTAALLRCFTLHGVKAAVELLMRWGLTAAPPAGVSTSASDAGELPLRCVSPGEGEIRCVVRAGNMLSSQLRSVQINGTTAGALFLRVFTFAPPQQALALPTNKPTYCLCQETVFRAVSAG